jgi:tetratricopeptide (TPR) repeat protein
MEKPKEEKTTGSGGPSSRDIFASDESIHRLLDRMDGSADSGGSSFWQSGIVKVIVSANLILITALIAYLVFGPRLSQNASSQPVVAQPDGHDEHAMAKDDGPIIAVKEATAGEDPAVAMQAVQELYEKGQYDKALAGYEALKHRFASGQQEARLLTAYIQLKMALCLQRTNEQAEAVKLFNTCISGPSPVVASMASYYVAIIEMQKGRTAIARMRLYTCLALAGALPEDMQKALERECSLLLAQAATSAFLQAADLKTGVPDKMWDRPILDDPAAGLGYEELTSFIATGRDLFPSTVLIRQNAQQIDKAPSRWSIAAKNVGAFDILSGLGTQASFSMRWEASDVDKVRPVSVCLTDKSPDSASEIIAGCAGLMTSITNGVPTIMNPESIMSRDQKKRICSAEALLLLNRFILLYTRDESAAVAYFALGLVHEQTGAATAAIADYKLLASRYAASRLAPSALWNSSQIKLSLKDSAGARADLEQLVELNPDHTIYAQASLKLAELMMAEGKYKEADHVYRKVYNMNPSGENQVMAALGAGKCLYELKDDVAAAEWLTRYIQIEKNPSSPELYDASMCLAKCLRRTDRQPRAVEAIKFAMARELTPQQRTRASIELARTEMEYQSYIKALGALQNIPITPNLTDDEMDALLLTSRINCEIGMPEKSAIALQNAIDRAFNKERAANLALPLARSLVQMGQAQKAAEVLTRMLANVGPSAAANDICCELAEVNLILGHNSEAISLCTGLISLKPSDELIDRAFRIIGKAYTNMKQYDKAALAFAGRVSMDGGNGI